MTLREMLEDIENKVRDTYIVTIKYKYDFEKDYAIENHILEYDSKNDIYVWQTDWYEGQTDIEVLGYMPLGDVNTARPSIAEEEIESCIQTLRFLENNFINDHGIFMNDKHPDNIEKIIKFLKESEEV